MFTKYAIIVFMTDETRQEKFKRLASRRTNNVLNQLRLLGNLSNKANYDYGEEGVRKIFSTIKSQLRIVEAKFTESTKREFEL